MRIVAALAALNGLWPLDSSRAAAMDDVVLTLPRPLRQGEQAVVAVSVGAIGHSRIEVTTRQGERLGTISPFGVAAGHAGGTYLLPVPSGAVHDGRLALRFTVTSGGKGRDATTKEVTGVKLSLPED